VGALWGIQQIQVFRGCQPIDISVKMTSKTKVTRNKIANSGILCCGVFSISCKSILYLTLPFIQLWTRRWQFCGQRGKWKQNFETEEHEDVIDSCLNAKRVVSLWRSQDVWTASSYGSCDWCMAFSWLGCESSQRRPPWSSTCLASLWRYQFHVIRTGRRWRTSPFLSAPPQYPSSPSSSRLKVFRPVFAYVRRRVVRLLCQEAARRYFSLCFVTGDWTVLFFFSSFHV
jgi:hypothetical protein